MNYREKILKEGLRISKELGTTSMHQLIVTSITKITRRVRNNKVVWTLKYL
jgi:hypothetical protein